MAVEPVKIKRGFQETESLKMLKESAVNVNLCYQCRKCSSGCPVADLTARDSVSDRTSAGPLDEKTGAGPDSVPEALRSGMARDSVPNSVPEALRSGMDLTPIQIIRAVRLGLEDLALNSKTIWLCTGCETCATRCPQDIDIAKVNSILRIMAYKRGIKPKLPNVAAFDRQFMANMKFFGRVYEMGLVNQLKLATRNFMQDMDLAGPMIFKGKIGFFPNFSGFLTMKKFLSRFKKARAGKN
ncbi:MAG: 4Fe-4S dicluster domain-containing protein [Elusimicrobia bacterium]|nr:4Fe-4S dicluster domain-containing protein [Elusimicrobiota bacterium]